MAQPNLQRVIENYSNGGDPWRLFGGGTFDRPTRKPSAEVNPVTCKKNKEDYV